MGDVGDVHLGGDGGMERGDAQIIPPPGVGKVPREGGKEVVCRCTCNKILQAHHVAVGGGMDEVSGGVHLDVGILRLPHRVSAHGIEELVNTGRERGHMQKFKGEELAAQFPPQGCGPAPPPEVGVAGGAAHVDVDGLGGGVEGCCPGHNIIHPQCPRQVCRLLPLMVGDGEGFVVGEGVGCGVGARGRAGELGHSLLGHDQKRMRRL